MPSELEQTKLWLTDYVHRIVGVPALIHHSDTNEG